MGDVKSIFKTFFFIDVFPSTASKVERKGLFTPFSGVSNIYLGLPKYSIPNEKNNVNRSFCVIQFLLLRILQQVVKKRFQSKLIFVLSSQSSTMISYIILYRG